MKRFLDNLQIDRRLLLEFMLVFAAFLTMALIGILYGTRIVNKNVVSYGNEVMNSSAETIKAYLSEYTVTIDDVAFSIERLKNENADIDEIHANLASWTGWVLGKDEYESFLSIYCVVDGKMIDGQYAEPPEGYIPESRPWYIGALEKNGDIHYCDPYQDVRTGETVLTVSKLLRDKDGVPFGVIALDVFITSVTEFVDELRLMDSGYGMLLDSNRVIAIHPDDSLIGMKLENVNEGTVGIAGLLAVSEEVSEFSYTNYSGEKSVAFFKELFNGWFVGLVSPSKVYYSDVDAMRTLLSVVGFALMSLLCMVLAYMHIEKNRSDEANRVKTSFLANMSHEIRTPMNAIIGMTELLLKEKLSNRQQGYVNDINTSSQSLLSIINDILDLSKIEAGKLELNPIDYDFYLFLDNICSISKFVSQKKNLEFRFEEEGEMPKCLFGDDIRLRQVLTNILGNAVKFTNQGYIRMKVTSTEDTLKFEVEDTGMGIHKEDLPKLFEPFTQADSKRNRSITGTGLGLPISKSFVEMMGGRITAESVYGQGTIFTITIPKVIGNEKEIVCDNKSDGVTFSAPTAKILVVDDNELNLKVAVGLLSLYGIHAVTAQSGREAIDLIKENDYDIVFMDHMMPEMDGVETTHEIRKLGGKYKKLVIVALTANTIRGAKELFISNGFDGFISKPIDTDDLVAILKGMLPAAKIEGGPTEQSVVEADPAENSFLEAVNSVTGINVEVGLKHASGMENMYRESIVFFNKMLLADCEKMNGFLDARDLRNLAISVHGIKSSLAVIGAVELSETAFELEKASKDENIQYCAQYFPEFFAKLRALHVQLSALSAEVKKEALLPRAEGCADFLMEKVQAALEAADDFDADSAIGLLNELVERDFGSETNSELEKARNALVDFDFIAAIDILTKIRGGK